MGAAMTVARGMLGKHTHAPRRPTGDSVVSMRRGYNLAAGLWKWMELLRPFGPSDWGRF